MMLSEQFLFTEVWLVGCRSGSRFESQQASFLRALMTSSLLGRGPHKNCKNDACHLLFIQCDKCASKYNDCCSEACNEFISLDIDTQKKLRKDINKKVSSAKLSTKFRPKLYKLFNYWK